MKMSNLKVGEKPQIFVLVGLPASGKSTWTANKLKNSPYSFSIISSDDKIESYAKAQGKTYSEVFQDYAATAQQEIWQDFKKAIKAEKNIIWDQTNMTIKKRKSILSQLPNGYVKTAVVFKINDDELVRRLNSRAEKEGKHIPEHVIKSMTKSYQEPTENEGFDNVIFV